VFIDIHGGGFMSGDKELNRLFGLHMAQREFLVFNLNYQLAVGNVKVTNQILDIAAATAWVREHLEQYNGDSDKIFICGHSAGAVLAAVDATAAQSSRLREVFGITGNGFLPYSGLVADCGLMAFYQRSVGYWGMRSMVFDKGYKHDDKYRNMIWREVPELAALPKTFLISNSKDELRYMTTGFKRILDEKGITNRLNYQIDNALGHMAVIYNPDAADCAAVIDDMAKYLLGRP
jgi:acetyl esterase/lipase